MSDDLGAIVQQWISSTYSAGVEGSALHELVAPDCVVHQRDGVLTVSSEWFASIAKYWLDAVPDFHCEIEDQVVADDRVATRFRVTGRHSGTQLFGLSASGREFAAGGMNLVRIEKGLIVEMWEFFDKLGLMRQLGADLYAPEDALEAGT